MLDTAKRLSPWRWGWWVVLPLSLASLFLGALGWYRNEAPDDWPQPKPILGLVELLPWWGWALIGLALLAAFIFVGAHTEIQRLDRAIENKPRPHLVFGKPYKATRLYGAFVSSFQPATSAFQPQEVQAEAAFRFGFVKIANDPTGVDYPVADANKVVAHLTYLHGGKPIRLKGRWGKDQPQAAQLKPGESVANLAMMDFPANGIERELDLGFAPERSTAIYAYSDESAFLEDWRDKKVKLVGDDLAIEIKLVGAGEVLASWRFLVQRKGFVIEPDLTDAATLAAYTGSA